MSGANVCFLSHCNSFVQVHVTCHLDHFLLLRSPSRAGDQHHQSARHIVRRGVKTLTAKGAHRNVNE